MPLPNIPNINFNYKAVNRLRIFLIIIISILLAGNVFFGFKYFFAQKDLRNAEQALEGQQINEKVLNFSKLFIEKVLKAEGEIGFEERLKLENAVRDLGDEKILDQWNKFVESKDALEAQKEVKNLLELLVFKIKVR